jgi:hypothetical protein
MGSDFWLTETTILVTRNGQTFVIASKSSQAYYGDREEKEFVGVDPDDPKEMAAARAKYKERIEKPRVLWRRATDDEELRGLWRKAADEHGVRHKDVVEVHVIETREGRC